MGWWENIDHVGNESSSYFLVDVGSSRETPRHWISIGRPWWLRVAYPLLDLLYCGNNCCLSIYSTTYPPPPNPVARVLTHVFYLLRSEFWSCGVEFEVLLMKCVSIRLEAKRFHDFLSLCIAGNLFSSPKAALSPVKIHSTITHTHTICIFNFFTELVAVGGSGVGICGSY